MKDKFILDACALIAFLTDEIGAYKIEELLHKAEKNEIILFMHKINLLEIFYGLYREDGEEKANTIFDLISQLPILIINDISDEVLKEAGRLKAIYKISLADSIVLTYASIFHYKIVTSDHHEFDYIEKQEEIKFCWIR